MKVNLFHAERFSEDAFRVKRTYIDAAGDLVAGILLGQIVFWFMPTKDGREKVTIERDGRKWIAKRRADWWDEIRITDRQYDRAIRILERKGFVELAFFKRGQTPVPHISLNREVVEREALAVLDAAAVATLDRPNTKSEDGPNTKSEVQGPNTKREVDLTQSVKSSTKQRLLTETTTETTARAGAREEKAAAAVMDAFFTHFGSMPNAIQIERVGAHLDDGMEPALILDVFERAALGGKSYTWADAALRNISNMGVKTLEDYKRAAAERRGRHDAKHRGHTGGTSKAHGNGSGYKHENKDFSDIDFPGD